MKLTKIAAATMWLPGFDPNFTPEVESFNAEIIPFPVAPTFRKEASKQSPWPALRADVFDNLSGAVTKYDANIASIVLLRQLESEGRQPTSNERDTLNRYTGWGGLPQAFNPDQKDACWAKRSVDLSAFLSGAEWESAFASTNNAHYTSLEVVHAMWDAVARLGFKGGRVLDPSAGVGYFMGGMPQEIAQNSAVTAIELDDISARILKQLYGDKANVQQGAFEANSLPENFFDLAISNVPFGNYGVIDHRNVAYSKYLIHDYFFARALDLVRPSGIVAFITSSGTMDKHESEVRAHIQGKADLIAAIRLPNTTFKSIANTEVTADIIFLQKRADGALAKKTPVWLSSEMLPTSSPIHGSPTTYAAHYFQINQYFVANPQNVIGKICLSGGGYRSQLSCVFGGELAPALAERVGLLPEGAYQAREHGDEPATVVGEDVAQQGYCLIDGVLYEKTGRLAQKVVANAKKMDRIIGMMQIRDAARELISAQPVTDDDSVLSNYRLALNASYDCFVRLFGYLSERANRLAFRNDPSFPLLLSLENTNAETGKVAKADIFFRRTVGAVHRIEKTDDPREAMMASIIELGGIDEAHIADLTGAPASLALSTLEADGLVFLDPETSKWETSDAYLSGNVRDKIKVAQASGKRFSLNVGALEAVIPADLSPTEIGARVGATWIPISDYEDFLNHLSGTDGNKVEFSALAGAWSVKEDFLARYSVACTQTYGTSRINAVELFTMALNQVLPSVMDAVYGSTKRVINQAETIAAREKQQSIRDAFVEWLWTDDARANRLVRLYNDGFNSIVQRKYNGDHLSLPGFSRCVTLHQHQKDAIWRIISSGYNTLLAHVVGAGKTLAAICSGMELRRLGRANKPLFVTPNHMLAQFTNEFLRAYPSAKLLMATKDDLAGDSRRQFLSRIATGDWDAVLMTQASFERIKMSDAYMAEYIEAELERIETALRECSQDRGNRIVKELARAKKQWRVKLGALSATHRKDDLLTFEDLGVDWLFVDEAHFFKNLYRHTKMTRIAGLPNTNSERSFDMLVKTRHVMAKHGHRSGVVFMTGTPVSNSMAELHAMQRFLQPRMLEAANLAHFDTWAGNFGESVNALELAPDGSGYRMQTRFARFINLPELMGLFRQVADIRTADMLQLPVPIANMETCVIKPSDELRAFVATLVERAEDIRNGLVTPDEDNMLSVTGDGRKAALDMRLVNPGAARDSEGKIATCANNVFRIWKDSTADLGTQVVFCDLSTPRNDGVFSAYNDMRDHLIDLGIPAKEIAFIHDYDSDAAKEALFASVREGVVRVVLGSTPKLGVGTNVQTRLVALHHLDAPWRPSDVEQREGRIIRQGNRNQSVWVYRYVTEASFDAYIWQCLEGKLRFITQIMQGDNAIRNAEDIELAALSYAEVKALASGNPMVLEKAAVDTELAKLSILKTQWGQQIWRNKQEIAGIPARIARLENRIENLKLDQSAWASAQSKQVLIQGIACKDNNEIGEAISKATRGQRYVTNEMLLGNIGHFAIVVNFNFGKKIFTLRGYADMEVGTIGSAIDAASRIVATAESLNALIRDEQDYLSRTHTRRNDIAAEINKPFEKQARFEELQQRQREIEQALDLNKGDTGAMDDVDFKEAA